MADYLELGQDRIEMSMMGKETVPRHMQPRLTIFIISQPSGHDIE